MINRIKLSSFKIHNYSKYDFAPGINAIVGPGGCGKTSIMEAIGWSTFGTLPGKKANFVSLLDTNDGDALDHAETSGHVKLLMDFDHKFIEINKALGGYSSLYVNGKMVAEGEMAVREALAELIGYKKPDVLFSGLVGITQGSLDAIFARSTSERVKVFSKILDIDKYKVFSDWLLKPYQDLNMGIALVQAALDRLEDDKVECDAISSERDAAQAELAAVSRAIEEEKSINSPLKDELESVTRLRHEILGAEVRIKDLCGGESAGDASVDVKLISDFECPTCGERLEGETREVLLRLYEKKLSELLEKQDEIDLLLAIISAKKKLIDLSDPNVEGKKWASDIRLESLLVKWSELRGKLEILTKSTGDIPSKIESEKAKLASMKGALAKLDTVRTAARKLPALIAVDTTLTVSELATEFVRMIYNDWLITWREDFSIDVHVGKFELSFGQLSKSQKAIAALSVVLALAKLVSPMDFILLDEPFANMDAEQVTSVASAIRDVGWFEQVILTTHRVEVEHVFDNVIEVHHE